MSLIHKGSYTKIGWLKYYQMCLLSWMPYVAQKRSVPWHTSGVKSRITLVFCIYKIHNDSEIKWAEIQRSQGHSWGRTRDNVEIVIRGRNLALGFCFELFICNMNNNGFHIPTRRVLGYYAYIDIFCLWKILFDYSLFLVMNA